MINYSNKKIAILQKINIHGYIFKRDSPSCGLKGVRIYGRNDVPNRNGQGIYAKAITDAFPLLPVEEEGRLNDHRLRENFVTRVFSYSEWQNMIQ